MKESNKMIRRYARYLTLPFLKRDDEIKMDSQAVVSLVISVIFILKNSMLAESIEIFRALVQSNKMHLTEDTCHEILRNEFEMGHLLSTHSFIASSPPNGEEFTILKDLSDTILYTLIHKSPQSPSIWTFTCSKILESNYPKILARSWIVSL